jgi:hypothetical protein
MANLRLKDLAAVNSITIKAIFTDFLDPLINTSNVEIVANTPGLISPAVKKVEVVRNGLRILTEPLVPGGVYFITFKSSDSIQFKSKNGQSLLLEDGRTNVVSLLGPEIEEDEIRRNLKQLLSGNIYNLDPGTIVNDIVNSQVFTLSRALHDIGQLKNDNYLSYIVANEGKVRGVGPYDRLNEEGAYEIIRVGKSLSGKKTSISFDYSSFPRLPITLLRSDVFNEALEAGAGSGTFNNFILTAKNNFVSKLNKVLIKYASGGTYEYIIPVYGYQIKDSRYDENFASPLLTLENNQFKLNSTVLDDGFVVPGPADEVVIDYEYKSRGRYVLEDTITVSEVVEVTREAVPPVLTEFTLDNSPIVDSSDIIPIDQLNGVTFLDPNSNPPFSATHPAFLKEIPFRLEGLPSFTGEYSIDYNTGRVFVFGATTNDGTGNYPPLASYRYRRIYSNRLDYTYDPSTSELVANPLRSLIGQNAKLSFEYESNLVPDIDYRAQIHEEILDERIENRILSSNSLAVKNTPITNVFRIYNETSGEIYNVTRFNDNRVYFSSINTPRIESVVQERASFAEVLNELVLVNNEFSNILGIRILKILLENNRIIGASEDVIGASFNSSVTFSRGDLFETELYYDSDFLTESENTDRLTVGQYQVDYQNGVVYLAVLPAQDLNLGTVNYRKPAIKTANAHITSVSDIYYNINFATPPNFHINYNSFTDNEVFPIDFDIAAERFFNGDVTSPYVVSSDTITVTDDVKNVRNIVDVFDLNNNITPTNFAGNASVSDNIITLDPLSVKKSESSVVEPGLVVKATFLSPGIEISNVESVVRDSDNVELFVAGSTFAGYDITLSGGSGAVVGDSVTITYNLRLNGAATPVVDYNRGDYFIDYNYLADEILVSYEYGDNKLDFTQTTALNEGDTYFVSYKVGALRDSLLQNFGTLVNLPVLNSFDTTLPRERYRDALTGALQSFTKGPTIPAIKSLVSSITHIDPEIEEAAFIHWALGVSYLDPDEISTTGDLQLLSGKFDTGVLLEKEGETVTFPVTSNLRLEEGALETWVIPDWNGLDNDASLTFQIFKNGFVLDSSRIFIGADSHNPTYDSDNKFILNRKDKESPIGLPSAIFTETGCFIFYNDDESKWKVIVKDSVDGYGGSIYQGTVKSSGEVYDVKFISGLGEITDVLRSGTDSIEFTFKLDGYDGYDGYFSFDGIDFMADNEHYIFDFGKEKDIDRFSLYKDGRGYLNFRVYDKGGPTKNRKNVYKISADIQDWKAGEKHHIATTWKLNTLERQDEMHLFIDGQEVPNIMRYGGRPIGASSDRFRTVKPELLLTPVPANAITGADLNTVVGSDIVISDGINFGAQGIVPGNTISIKEPGFFTYTILAISDNVLTLDSPMPSSLEDARFSVNEFSSVVSTDIDLYKNIIVTKISGGIETELPGPDAVLPAYEISKNALLQNVLTILGDVSAGDQIAIRTLGLNFRRARDKSYIWGNTTSIFKTQLPPPINLNETKIISILFPLEAIGPSNATLVLGRYVATGLTASQPSNSIEGRILAVRITGSNVDFTNPPTVTINGTTAGGPVFETLTFTSPTTLDTVNKFLTISSIDVESTPIVPSRDTISVEVREAFSITEPNGNSLFPIIRFAYKVQAGSNLFGDGLTDIVTDNQGYFTDSMVGNALVINSPPAAAGTYTISSRIDTNSVRLSPAPPVAFSGGSYDIFNISIGRSGFQNGFFVLEEAGSVNTPWTLNQGLFEFDFQTYLQVDFNPLSNEKAFVGSDLYGRNQANAVIDEFRILSKALTDIRVGEPVEDNVDYITTDFTSLRPFEPNSDTLMLLHFDSLPLVNDSDFWITADKTFLQSSSSVNSRFEKSLVVGKDPLIVDNKGFLSTASEGSIEFWVSPKFDTANDPNRRFYFDASSSVIEESVSLTSASVKLSGRASRILSVRLQTDTDNTGVNYFVGGELASDFQTINLGQALPFQNTPVKVYYVPSGVVGDRISIYKDEAGFITFNVRINDIDYQVRQPVFWSRNTWHRIMATYKFNRKDNLDEIRLFVDGEEKGTVLFGSGLLFGQGAVFGQGLAGVDNSILTADLNFKDVINEFFVGSDIFSANLAQARFDNLRLSNISRNTFTVAGQPKDINFSSNRSIVYPVIEDVFTTYLLNFNTLISKTDDIAILINENFGIFNFTIKILDSFGIVLGNDKTKQVLETLIESLKPAQSKATLDYIE